VLTTDTALICRSGYTQSIRNVLQALKEQVYREYGITSREPGEYEIDHVVSLELGGSNSARNLCPESYKTQPLNAHIKDALENRLHALACSGKITMQQAQTAIAGNWTVAYTKYVGPLPGGVSVVKSTQSPVPAARRPLSLSRFPVLDLWEETLRMLPSRRLRIRTGAAPPPRRSRSVRPASITCRRVTETMIARTLAAASQPQRPLKPLGTEE